MMDNEFEKNENDIEDVKSPETDGNIADVAEEQTKWKETVTEEPEKELEEFEEEPEKELEEFEEEPEAFADNADETMDEDSEPEVLAEEQPSKKGLWQRFKERELEKQRIKEERYLAGEERMAEVRRQRIAEMYADGKEPNKLQKFLMEGKYINYENKQTVVFWGIVIFGIIVFSLVYAGGFITKEKFGLGGEASRAIVYSKENELYCYNLKSDPVLISENLSAGGSATYSYVGNGTTVAEDGTSVYFIDNIAADGRFNLNYYNAKNKGQTSFISADVSDYKVSLLGEGTVYIVAGESGSTGTLYGYSRKTNASKELAQDIQIGNSYYDISADGSKAIYVVADESGFSINECALDGSGVKTIDTDVAQYLVSKNDNYVYYVKTEGSENGVGSYTIYRYDLKKSASEMIDDNVIAVTLSRDENAVIYYKYTGNMIKGTDIINDDGDDSEATKALRAEIADYEFQDILCEVYRYEDGTSKLVGDKVLAAMPMDDEGEYIAYTVPSGTKKIKVNLSEISSVNEIAANYYMQIMKADCDVYIYKLNGFNEYMVFENSYIYSYQNSGNDAQFACFVDYDESTKKGKLILATYGDDGMKSYGELEDDVESFQFMGDGARIAYLRDVQDDGTGTLMYVESNVPDEISDSAYYYEVSTDLFRRVFYLDNYNSETYGGDFHYYQQASDKLVDSNVYMFAYRNNNNAFYLKDYDKETGTGDLYYLKGSKSVLVDEDVSSVFDFYDAQ